METIKVKRTFMHPEYRSLLSYNDIALSELSRRIMFDFEKYGDSPMCLSKSELLDGKQALVQGFGLTEKGEQSAGLLQANVTIISNKQCAQILKHNVSDHLLYKQRLKNTLKYGIIDQLMCSVGTKDEITGNTSVSYSMIFLDLLMPRPRLPRPSSSSKFVLSVLKFLGILKTF